VARPTSLVKRLLLGRPFRSDRLQHTLLPKRIALPVFASDALSSVAYAPDEILLTLSVGGAAFYAYSWRIGIAVAVVMLVVVASYRQNVHAYPSGGGDYEVATVNLGPKFGLVVASALMVDYVLTVAVSVSSGVANIGSAWPFARDHPVGVAVTVVAVLAATNLRGIREAGLAFAIPTYAFMISVLVMVGWGFIRIFAFGNSLEAASATEPIVNAHSVTGFAFAFLMIRAFSSGSAALTGVEAISNGVPAFKKPKSKNAATTLLLLGTLAVTMLIGIVVLANLTHVHIQNATDQPVTPQLAHTVFGSFSAPFYIVVGATALILVLAANTAFNGFPVLGSILAQDRYLPRQLHTRGDRLAFSNGILFLATFAVVLIVAFKAQPTHLIQLYIVGVFVSFTLSQSGMLRHWNRLLRTERDRQVRRRMYRSRAINGIGAVMTGFVLVLVILTKFLAGAWISIAAMVVIYMVMIAIRRHYDHVASELAPAEERPMLPARNHAVVLVSKVHLPTLRALAYAQATRPDTLSAVTVNVDDADTRKIQEEWEARDITVPLVVVDSPYREISRPVIDYVKSLRKDSPRDVVTVFIPEYVVGKWFENLLHNQSALRLKGRLLYEPGVMVTSVPWQLNSSVGKNLSKYDREVALAPLRGPRGQRSSYPPGAPSATPGGAPPATPGRTPPQPPSGDAAANGNDGPASANGGSRASSDPTSDPTAEPNRTSRP
jgi:amino acid transporter